ncbi:unnamed protein product [Ceratitis capitata]|uniref:CLIP domain-containing serine protease n=1 Tax=Ceratitis capitata TaxID=7213 RepID=A0A811UYI4_CERCA|nr:unnamed protein product [Ceratitis capitata]
MKRLLCKLFVIVLVLSAVGLIKSQSCVDSSLRSGQCVHMNSCPQLIQDYYEAARTSPYIQDFQTFVSGSMCGFDGYNFMICCASLRSSQNPILPQSNQMMPNPAAPQQLNTNTPIFTFSALNTSPSIQTPTLAIPTTPTSPLTPSIIPTMNMPVIPKGALINPTQPSILPSYNPPIISSSTTVALPTRLPMKRRGVGCGLSGAYTNKVVGGTEVRRGAYPWIVALGYRDEFNANTLKFLCAGSLISARYVLTSGHCITPMLYTARLGAHDLSDPNEAGAVNIPIARKIIHEQYDARYVINDIGLVQLSAPAPETAYIGLICLPAGEVFAKDFVGNNPFIAGWGAVKFQGPSSNVLRDVQVPIVNQQTCEQSYKSVFQNLVFTEKFICAGNSHVDACQGDSGGPLMMPLLEDGVYHYFILGLVSYGYECARPGFPGVYTRVTSYMPWILAHMV